MTAAHLPHPSRPSGPLPGTDRLRRRSAGLRHVHGVTRWTLIGSAASTLLLGLGYAHALPDLATLLPAHLTGDRGHGTGGTTGTGGFTGGGGAQAPTLPGTGGGGQTATGAS
ncbi:hypothetical protein ABH931_005103 [Streptacidiphilus sp. MAP12-33]|uniref:hypothetical protein n=1 Tax=Streptacidiphilus sp. MAP12-33 TaxID=3156266 RepID=UPI003518A1FA